MARVLDTVTMPIKKNGTKTPQEYVNNPKSTAPQFSASTAYTVGQYVFYNKKLYRFKAAHAAGAWNAAHVDEVTVASELNAYGEELTQLKADLSECETALETKAEIDGSYDTMTVGNAKQLTSNVGINDKAPYVFRTAGGANDIGDREEDTIVGGSVVWNQLSDPSIYTVSANASVSTTGNVTEVTIGGTSGYRGVALYKKMVVGHKYLFRAKSFESSISEQVPHLAGNFNYGGNNYATLVSGTSPINVVFTASTENLCLSGWPSENPVWTFDTIQISDLTAMFGTAIADYIYSLEQATAGAGIAWLRKYGFFTKDYYPYFEPTFKHVEGLASHKMTGFNQWDEQWEVGGLYNATGLPWQTNDRIRSKDFISILPNTVYYTNKALNACCFYDSEQNFINGDAKGVGTFTTPEDAAYMKFATYSSYGTTYKNDINIHLHWDGERDGEYEAYKEYTYPLDSDVVLRGIPKLDANNDLYYDGDRYLPDGTVERNYILIDLGTVNFDYYSSGGYFRSAVYSAAKAGANNVVGNLLCSAYVATAPNAINDKTINIATNGRIVIRDDSFNGDATAFNASLSGVYLLAEAATPTEETADPYQSPQIVDDWGTEEYVYTDGAFPIPVGHDTFYAANLKAKLEMAPDSPGDGDGDYVVRQTNGLNEYVKMVKELPSAPTTDGTYHLEVTVASGTPTLTWVADE